MSPLADAIPHPVDTILPARPLFAPGLQPGLAMAAWPITAVFAAAAVPAA